MLPTTNTQHTCIRCRQDNKLGCTGYCATCYDIWRAEMYSFYGPGPWVHMGAGKYLRASAYRQLVKYGGSRKMLI